MAFRCDHTPTCHRTVITTSEETAQNSLLGSQNQGWDFWPGRYLLVLQQLACDLLHEDCIKKWADQASKCSSMFWGLTLALSFLHISVFIFSTGANIVASSKHYISYQFVKGTALAGWREDWRNSGGEKKILLMSPFSTYSLFRKELQTNKVARFMKNQSDRSFL